MAKRAKSRAKVPRAASKLPTVASGELVTLLDFVRYAVSRFTEAKLTFAHGTPDPVAEAAFLVCEALHLHPDQFETFATARVTAREAKSILELIARRIATRKPAAYLVHEVYSAARPVLRRRARDRAALVHRRIAGSRFPPGRAPSRDRHDAVGSVLDLCTGSGCLAILAGRGVPERTDRCGRRLAGCARRSRARNVADYGLGRPRASDPQRPVRRPLGDNATTSSSPTRPM